MALEAVFVYNWTQQGGLKNSFTELCLTKQPKEGEMKNSTLPMYSLFSGEGGEAFAHFVFAALLSDNTKEMDAVIERMDREGYGSDELRYNLIGLKAFREQHEENAETLKLSETEKAILEEYEDEWTMDLVGMLNRCHQIRSSGNGLEPGFVPH